jgi:HEAT repeat protein
VEGLLRLGDTSALLLAADLARHPDPSVRGAIAQALSATSSPKVLPLLDSLLRDQQPLPRLMAARALGKTGLPNAVSTLKTGLRDTDAAVRITAAASVFALLESKSGKTPGKGKG